MKRGAFVIKAARGPIVDERALVEALGSGQLAGAALDVYEVEPLALDSPLRKFENVILSPHVGGATLEADSRVVEMVGDNLRPMLKRHAPLIDVNTGELCSREVSCSS